MPAVVRTRFSARPAECRRHVAGVHRIRADRQAGDGAADSRTRHARGLRAGPGPMPSGVLQFGAASFAVDEWAGAPPSITVTRTGGGSGAVTAAFTTSNGTAIGGWTTPP